MQLDLGAQISSYLTVHKKHAKLLTFSSLIRTILFLIRSKNLLVFKSTCKALGPQGSPLFFRGQQYLSPTKLQHTNSLHP